MQVIRKAQQGFTLIELLIVVAIIGIIAAIAVPNLMQSRAAANEASAISSVRSIVTAQMTYAATVGNGQFAPDLGTLSAADMIDEALGAGAKDGYNIVMGGGGTVFTVNADPMTMDVTGRRGFFSDESAVIRFVVGGAAGPGSPPLGGVTP